MLPPPAVVRVMLPLVDVSGPRKLPTFSEPPLVCVMLRSPGAVKPVTERPPAVSKIENALVLLPKIGENTGPVKSPALIR
jgi:hypothetical protein